MSSSLWPSHLRLYLIFKRKKIYKILSVGTKVDSMPQKSSDIEISPSMCKKIVYVEHVW